MKHAEASTPWKAIGIREWINAGRWWLLKVSKAINTSRFLVLCTSLNMKQYQLQAPIELGRKHNVISNTVYTCLIKASWVLSDVISKHPQLGLLEAAVQHDVQSLAEVRQLHFPASYISIAE